MQFSVLACNDITWSRIFALAHEEMHGAKKAESSEGTIDSSSDGEENKHHSPGKSDTDRPQTAGSQISLSQLNITDKRYMDWRQLFAGRGMVTLQYHCIENGKVPSAKAVVRGTCTS